MPELQFGFFEYAWIGIPITIAGIVYMMFIGKYLLPKDSGTLNLEIDEEILENETSTQKQIFAELLWLVLSAAWQLVSCPWKLLRLLVL